jgi:acyl-CoA synthetase (NDP forming)
MVLAIMVIPWEAVRNFKTVGFRVQDWFGDVASFRGRCPDKPLVGVVVGHPEYVDDMASLCGPSVPIFTSPEAATRALAELWSYSKARKKSGDKRSE